MGMGILSCRRDVKNRQVVCREANIFVFGLKSQKFILSRSTSQMESVTHKRVRLNCNYFPLQS